VKFWFQKREKLKMFVLGQVEKAQLKILKMVFISTFILLIYMYSVWSKLSPSKILTSVVNVENAFESISQIFDDLDYDENEIESTLKKISSNQAALKSMDGLTHQIRSSLGDR
jgi:hypothetical protein